jgi:hypothetical protein
VGDDPAAAERDREPGSAEDRALATGIVEVASVGLADVEAVRQLARNATPGA